MAGEGLRVVNGRPITIRAVATADAAEGDVFVSGKKNGATAGFWLHDVKMGEEGDLCIDAAVVEGDNPGMASARVAGEPLVAAIKNSDTPPFPTTYAFGSGASIDRGTPGVIAKVYRSVPARTARFLMVWGHH